MLERRPLCSYNDTGYDVVAAVQSARVPLFSVGGGGFAGRLFGSCDGAAVVNAIETKDLSKIYKDFWGRPRVKALNSLNLTVRQGEVFGLLGPNGSGKTTTTKLLLGLIFPTSGQAYVLGKPAGDVATKARIGFLPEESYLYRFLNAEETLDFYGRLFKIPKKKRREKIDQLIEMVGLTDARKRPLKEYSKGMTRRIGLAQALINDPDVIFLDEPTSGLDPIGTREVKNLIIDLRKKGKTVLLCSHLLADVEEVCDRIALLVNGHLRKLGEVKELLSDKDALQFTVKKPPPDARRRIEKLVAEMGASLESVQNPVETLEELFLEVVRREQERKSQAKTKL